jgi:single-strand DNA-binding protein
MEIIGRLTADAKVTTLKDERKVVNFSIAINDSYRAKGSGERTQLTTYVQCAYWVSSSIAPYLTKGTLVELSGRMSADAWVNMDGEAKAALRFHVSALKLHGRSTRSDAENRPTAAPVNTAVTDDLPF